MPYSESFAEGVIRKKAPDLPGAHIAALAAIWDEVVHRIVQGMLALDESEDRELHVNMRAEMSLDIAKMLMFFTEGVVEKRVGNRDLHLIGPEVERSECFGPAGVQMIETTARNFYEGYWRKRMEERWLPKSRKALEREIAPPTPTKLSVRPVRDKHYHQSLVQATHRFDRSTLVYPIIFTYRQFLELSLKYLIATFGYTVGVEANWSTHSLSELWKRFVDVLDGYGVSDPGGADAVVAEIVAEFAKVDPNSFAFRYPVDRKGVAIPLSQEQLDLVVLADVMTAAENYFTGCDGYLDSLQSAGP